jgi:hypothetical protein
MGVPQSWSGHRLEEKPFSCAEDRILAIQSVVRHCTDYTVQTSSGAQPAFYPMGTGVPFPGGKAWPGRDADHLDHQVPRS